METLERLKVPGILSRFIGNWMTARTFRDRLIAPTGQCLSKPYAQNRGVPQGGVLSPLMWLVLVNSLPERVRKQMRFEEPGLEQEKDLLLQIFADDISVAVRGATVTEAVHYAEKLAKVLQRVPAAIGLHLSWHKCKNFLVQALRGGIRLFSRADPTSRRQRTKVKKPDGKQYKT